MSKLSSKFSAIMGFAGAMLAALLLFAACQDPVLGDQTATDAADSSRAVSSYDTSLSGNYYIKNVNSGLYLDVANGGTSNGTNIQQYAYNGSTAQQFNLVYVSSGYYGIKTVCSGSAKALDVWGKSTANGTNIATYSYGGGSNQLFKFTKQSDGSYVIYTKMTGDASVIEVAGWSTANGGNVAQWAYHGGANQRWILTKVSGTATPTPAPTATPTPTATPAGTGSKAFAKSLQAGWNLGNTLDAFSDDKSATYSQGLYSEACWGQPYTTQTMIKAIKAAGFKTIRLPVTWHNHIDNASYQINATWMARVKTVVDWAIAEGLYVILNTHHDNISLSSYNSGVYGYVLNASYKTSSKAYLKAVWTQIANTFKAYDDHLIFEALNEPRDVGGSNEWYIASSSTAKTYNDIITEYEQTCLDAIRATGGNNASRYVLVPGYAGSASYLSTYTLPKDSASDKLLLSFHAYSPYNFAMYNSSGVDTSFDSADQTELNNLFSGVRNLFPNMGIVIGEASASNKNNLSARVAWASYYFGTAYNTYAMPTVLWDNGAYTADTSSGEQHGYYNRSGNSWYWPTIVSAALKAVGISPGL